MSFVNKIFHRSTAAPASPAVAPECPHLALAPHWDSVADIGHEARATIFVCDSCHRALTPAEAARARADSPQHVRIRA